jgi:ubiquinone/menaquinone biosynthesis C-methylase UbiE
MDYDATEIAVTYDRGRDHGPDFLSLWMGVVSSQLKDKRIKTILDLGCGTGRFSEALRAHFEAEVIGIDPSKKMLAQAESKPHHRRVRYVVGRAESIPLADHSIDLIFMSMIFHHFEDAALAARECHRVLRDQGTAILRAGTRERIQSYAYVDFFPQSLPILHERLPSSVIVREVFETAGFRTVTHTAVAQEIAPNYAAYAEKLAAGADSVLAQLSPRDFEMGIRAVREHAARSDEAVAEPIDVFVFAA